jgi:hypothetical protein
MREYMVTTSYPNIFSSCLLPYEIAGLDATLQVIKKSDAERARLTQVSTRLRASLSAMGYPVHQGTEQIIALESGSEPATLILRDMLEERGIFGAVFCAPATSRNRAMVRLTLSSALTDAEFARIREHVGAGVDTVSAIAGISDLSLAIVAQHHEHMNGAGYPAGLQGEQISQLGQMAAIVDVYEALTSTRPYRAAMEPSQALQRIFSWNRQFNNELVQRFIQCVGIYPVGTLVRLDSGMVAIVVEANPANLLRPTVRVVLDTRRDLIVTPRDLNLAKPTVKDRIVSAESAARWKINTGLYL